MPGCCHSGFIYLSLHGYSFDDPQALPFQSEFARYSSGHPLMDTVSSGTTVHLVKLVPPSTLSDLEFLHLLQERTKFLQDPILHGSYQYVEKLIITLGLAQTLRDYPHAAGRLSCDPKTQEWSIKLMNDGVPITVGTTKLHRKNGFIM